MKYCKRCVQPNTLPSMYFNKEGVCGGCLYEDEIKRIDWDARQKELHNIANWAKNNTKSNYDCAIGVSGGKDSTFQALYSRDRLGLRPLLINSEPENITELGKYNIENLKQLGFDVISLRPNPRVMKKLIKKCFYKYGNPWKITEYSLYASTYIAAYAFKIPLIIQGENVRDTLGLTDMSPGGSALNADQCNSILTPWKEFTGDGVEERDLFLYHYDKKKMIDEEFKGVWLSYYVKEWSQSYNYEFAVAHGFKARPHYFNPYDFGTYSSYYQLDSDLMQVNQMIKHVKFASGQCTDHACYDIRAGRIARQEAIELVRKYDGKCDIRFIKEFCDYIDISVDEFWRVVNSFRGPMWKQNEKGEWFIKNPIWKLDVAKEEVTA